MYKNKVLPEPHGLTGYVGLRFCSPQHQLSLVGLLIALTHGWMARLIWLLQAKQCYIL